MFAKRKEVKIKRASLKRVVDAYERLLT